VTSPFGEFDNPADDEHDVSNDSPLLPREDRLWRHPSELSPANWPDADSTAVIGRWLSGEGSKGSVWTAGFVGALLAAGVVIVGAHLATAFTTPPLSGARVITASVITTLPEVAPNLGSALTAAVNQVGRSLAVIDTESANGTRSHALGVVITNDGTVLTALAAVRGASSIFVDLPGTGLTSIGDVVGRDLATGLAVVRVRGESGLERMGFSNRSLPASSFAIALTTSTSAAVPAISVGALSHVNVVATTDDSTLMDADMTDLPAASNPLGSPLLDSTGAVDGIVTGSINGEAIVTPGWLAGPVASELLSTQAFDHGELDATAATVLGSKHSVAGVKLVKVVPGTLAAVAGLSRGDEILAVDGTRVTTLCELKGQLYVRAAGSTVRLAFDHSGHRRTAVLKLAA
jgi:serine protease Do